MKIILEDEDFIISPLLKSFRMGVVYPHYGQLNYFWFEYINMLLQKAFVK